MKCKGRKYGSIKELEKKRATCDKGCQLSQLPSINLFFLFVWTYRDNNFSQSDLIAKAFMIASHVIFWLDSRVTFDHKTNMHKDLTTNHFGREFSSAFEIKRNFHKFLAFSCQHCLTRLGLEVSTNQTLASSYPM